MIFQLISQSEVIHLHLFFIYCRFLHTIAHMLLDVVIFIMVYYFIYILLLLYHVLVVYVIIVNGVSSVVIYTSIVYMYSILFTYGTVNNTQIHILFIIVYILFKLNVNLLHIQYIFAIN